MAGEYPEGANDKVMHATVTAGGAMLMASDAMPGAPFQAGYHFGMLVDQFGIQWMFNCELPKQG